MAELRSAAISSRGPQALNPIIMFAMFYKLDQAIAARTDLAAGHWFPTGDPDASGHFQPSDTPQFTTDAREARGGRASGRG